MASKKEKSKKGGGEGKWNAEDDLQAVIIADSFNYRFLPVTIEKPRALLPLVNRPLIDYTVEFLAVAGVKEIFVFCCSHANLIKVHLQNSRWMKPSSPVKLQIIISENCPSVGDALRNIDSQSLIRSDFVLVSGDLVANMELQEVVDQHKEMKKKDKMSVMTCVYKEARPNHPTRSSEDDILIAVNVEDGRLLHCEKPRNKKKLNIPVSIFEENSDVDIRYDVLDCHVTVCAPTVPQLFSDNFDYQTRHHFIRGILVNEEIMGNHIYTHFISDQYAARVSNLHTYDAISKDVIHRWVYPLVPDNAAGEAYSYGRHNIYLSEDVALAVGTELIEDVVIGRGSRIGANSHISQSSIGRDCIIGENVSIEGSYIWDKVVIEDNCTIHQAIICDNAIVRAGVTLEKGCILSFQVVVDVNMTLASGSRVTTKRQLTSDSFSDSEWDDKESRGLQESSVEPESMVEYVGDNGHGYLWEPPTPDEDDESAVVVEEWPTAAKEEVLTGTDSELSSRSNSPPIVESQDAPYIRFYNETLDSIRSGIAGQVPNDNTILMINASKHAYNIPIEDVPPAVVKAIVEGPENSTAEQASELLLYVKNAISYFESLLQHYIKGPDTQMSVLQALVECAVQQVNIMTILPKVMILLYDADVLEEGAIASWYLKLQKAEVGFTLAKLQEVLGRVKPVMEWLENAEEESSGEDEEEDDEDQGDT
jgi:translation initiation factor eIF-2B subunit epsilon